MRNKIEYILRPDRLDRMELFDNRETRWTMEQVQEHLGCDVVFPGPYFDSHTFQPVVYCKIGGKYLCNPGYNNFGMLIADGKPKFGKIPQDTATNYVTNDVLVINGRKRAKEIMTIHPDGYDRRGRAVLMQLQDNSLLFRVTRDGGREADTVLVEQEHAVQVKAKWAINYDGGRSANIITPAGSILLNDYGQDHTRIMPVYIVLFLKKGGDKMTYSMKSQRGVKVAENFHVREFACHDGSDTVLIDPVLPTLLQRIRDHFGPIIINSGYRTPNYNRKIGGATHSQHVLGKAADIHINGVTPADIAQYADKLGAGGVGLYDSFVHVDVRARHVRWKNNRETNHHETVVSGFVAEGKTAEKPVESVHAEAIAWAKANGISDGSNLQSSPTKAEIISMLFRNEKRKGAE